MMSRCGPSPTIYDYAWNSSTEDYYYDAPPLASHNTTPLSMPQNEGDEEAQCYATMNPEQTKSFIQFEKIFGGYAICLVGILGLVGNVLAIVVLAQKEMKKSCFNRLLIGLVSFDSLHIIFAILESFRLSFVDYYPNFLVSTFPWFHFPMYRITLAGSIYMMIGTAIERYLAVCFPHNYHRMNAQSNRYLYYTVPAIGAALLINIPRFFETKTEIKTIYDENCTVIDETIELGPTELRLNRIYIIGYVNWIWTIATVILPLGTLIFFSIRIFQGLKKVRKNLNRHKRLVDKAQAAETDIGGVEPSCTVRITLPKQNGADCGVGPGDFAEMIPLKDMKKNGSGHQNSGQSSPDCDREAEEENCHQKETGTSPAKPRAGMITSLHPPSESSEKRVSITQRARTVAQRKLQSAAQSREANMAVLLVCTVIMFVVCHAPRMFASSYEAAMSSFILDCMSRGKMGIPVWFLYIQPIVKLLQVLNASGNFPIYFFMGSSFRKAFTDMLKKA